MRAYLLSSIAILSLSGCIVGSAGPHADMSKVSSLAGFERIEASAGVRVVLSQGPFAVKADSSNGNFEKLILHVSGDTLVASRDSGWLGDAPDYTITVSAPGYRSFEVSSGARLDGASIKASDLHVGVSSGARVSLSGACAGLDVDVSSGGRFDGGSLQCDAAKVGASSGGRADAFATHNAKGDASSGGSIVFHGSPVSIEKETSSGGSVSSAL